MPTPSWVGSYEERRGTAAARAILYKDQQVRLAEVRKGFDIIYPLGGNGFGDYLRYQHALIAAKKERTTQEEFLRRAQARARTIQDNVTRRLEQVFQRTGFTTQVQNAMSMGAEVARSLGQFTEGMGPEVQIGVTAGSYVLGAFLAFWPFEKQKLLDDYRAIFSALTPLERWCVMPSFRAWINCAKEKMRAPLTPEWRLGDDGGLLGHNIAFEGIDVLVLFLLEVSNEFNWVPADTDPRTYAYARALLVSYHDDNKKLSEMRDLWGKANARKPNDIVAALITGAPNVTAGDIRTEARSLGLRDFGNLLVTQGLLEQFARIEGT